MQPRNGDPRVTIAATGSAPPLSNEPMQRLVAMLLLVLTGTPARADRAAAEQLFRAASASREPAAFAACATAYLDAFDQDPRARDADELLYSAAVCHIGARSIAGAAAAFKQLRATFPTSKYTLRATRELADLDVAAARFDEAAAMYEEYAKRYAGEKDTADAMRDAIAYRQAIGDTAGVIADVRYFERTYGSKQPAATAALLLALVPTYEQQGHDLAIAQLRELVRRHDRDLDDTQRVVALGKLGELQWDATCKGRALCVTELPRDKVQRCAEGTRLRVDARAPTRDAEATLALAVRTYEERQPKDAAALHAYAMAKLRIADRALERYLALGFPTGLDVSSEPEKKAAKEASLKRFSTWVTERQKLGVAAQQQYEAVVALHDPEAAVAATARMGQLTADFAATLRTAEIPKDIRTGDFAKEKVAAFCEKMVEVAEPLGQRALETFGVCLAKSAELGVDGAWTALCRRGAVTIDPRMVVDAPLLPALIPAYPPPTFAPAPAPTPQDPPAYATLLAAAQAPGCPPFADRLKPLKTDGARYLAALVAARCNREPEARRGWEALGTPAALASLGSLGWNTGERTLALDAWARARQLDGTLAAPHYGLALAHFDDRAQERDVETGLVTASILEPDAAGPRVMLGLLALRRDRPAIAELYLYRGTAKGPALEIARAVLLARAGRWAEARAPLEAADKAHLPQAGYDLALVDLRAHRYDAALARLANVTPGYDALVAQGVAEAGLGKPFEPTFQAAIRRDPARPEAHFDLGLALAAQRKFAAAAAALDLAKATALADRYRGL